MNTIIIKDVNNINKAADILKQGGLVATPTETVYGLCANALNPVATENIFKAKGRPNDNPLIVHIADLAMLDDLVMDISPIAQKLIDAFWPGPLTLIFKAKPIIPKEVTTGLSTVAIRFPSHPIMQQLIKVSGLPLAAPSANTSGKPSPTNAARVIEDMNGKIDAIIDGDASEFGVESTIVDTTGDVATLLRPGGITLEMLQNVLGEVAIDPAVTRKLTDGEHPKAPGMKYKHYAPNAEVIIVSGELEKVTEYINSQTQINERLGKKIGVLATDETTNLFCADLVLSAGSQDDLLSIASTLFEQLRSFDDQSVDIVYSMAFPKTGIGFAIMNRLEKSAGFHIIYV